jgi:2-polyprenyl-3-methyl-5-hydroxy-6-metoxy-1,4-benzoquinol methylase
MWADHLRRVWDPEPVRPRPWFLHRKLWEWVFILEALRERGMLTAGRRGLGFGVGQDPLAAVFASYGVSIVATDADEQIAEAGGWHETGQHASSLADLNRHRFCDEASFNRLVAYRTVDMNNIPSDLRDFDFTWSSCAFEHLGSLDHGLQFVLRQMDCLKPGGFAVHTTEYNVSSNRATIEEGQTVLYRRQDIERLVSALGEDNHVIDVDYTTGRTPADLHVDEPPYTGETHLKIRMSAFVITSLALIIEKNPWSIEGGSQLRLPAATAASDPARPLAPAPAPPPDRRRSWGDDARLWLTEGAVLLARAVKGLARRISHGRS